MNDTKVKRQIAEKVKASTNILVAVSNDPSVDELSAALGLTLILNKLNKHVTTVFSGAIPPAIRFLKPEKTFESTADSLRDFIIALDKEKADHLRYKLEDDMVKIYITPYKSKITPDDLEYSQGDYNVDMIIALGVEDRAHLDHALASHGGVLHDATIVTVMVGERESNLGSLALHNKNSSSLCEELCGLEEALKGEETLVDKAVATALLTGIVSATERFSNPRTSSRTMTVAAKLMSAGADQQLIASKLATPKPAVATPKAAESDVEGELRLQEGVVTRLAPKKAASKATHDNKDMTIEYDKLETLEDVADTVTTQGLEESARLAAEALSQVEGQGDATDETEEVDEDEQASPVMAVAHESESEEPASEGDAPVSLEPASEAPALPPVQLVTPAADVVQRPKEALDAPVMGGTLSATTEQAQEDKRRALEADKSKTILKHSYLGNSQPTYDAPINGAVEAAEQEMTTDIFAGSGIGTTTPLQPDTAPTVEVPDLAPPVPAQPLPPPVTPAIAGLPVIEPLSPAPTLEPVVAEPADAPDAARQAVEAALLQGGFQPAAAPVPPAAPAFDLPLPPPPPPPMPSMGGGGLPMPPMPDMPSMPQIPEPASQPAQAPVAPPAMTYEATPAPTPSGLLGDILAAESASSVTFGQPMPQSYGPAGPAAPTAPQQPPAPSDPGQFRIPGQ